MVARRWSPLALFAAGAVLASGTLSAATKLALERLALHQYEDGPLLPSSHDFLPGETVWFSCRIAGFEIEPAGDNRNVKLSWQVGLLEQAERIGVRSDPNLRKRAGQFLTALLPPNPDAVDGQECRALR